MVKVNGEEKALEGTSLLKFLQLEGYNPALVAVEINKKIFPKKDYDSYRFSDGDEVEIVRFVGGG